MLSRRKLLAGVAGAVVARTMAAYAAMPGTSATTGHAQVNLYLPYHGIEFPFINAFKYNDRVWEPSGTFDEDIYATFDSNGMPTRLPNNRHDPGAYLRTYCSVYLTDNDPWVLDWNGAGKVALQVPDASIKTTQRIVTSSRIEYTFASTTQPFYYSFGVGVALIDSRAGSPVQNIRLYRKSQEALLSSGQNFAPDFISHYRNFGRIRFMDWGWTNFSMMARWQDRSTSSMMSWTGYNLIASSYSGTAKITKNDYVTAGTPSGGPTSWTDKMMVQFLLPSTGPAYTEVKSFSNALPPSVTAPGHGLSTGDIIFFQPGSIAGGSISKKLDSPSNPGAKAFYTITVTGPNTFNLDGIDSTTWGTYSSGGFVIKQLTLATSTLPPKPLIYPNGLQFYIQYFLKPGYLAQAVYDAEIDCLLLAYGPSAFTSSPGNIPYELMIELCNATNSSPWICLPHMADDDFVRQLATLVRNNLTPDLIANFEYSNEMWNAGFAQHGWANCQALAKWPSKRSTVTITNGSPATINWENHGLSAGATILLTTSGSLPSGLKANTHYFVSAIGLGPNSIGLSATPNGTSIDSSGLQWGKHTADFRIGPQSFFDFAQYVYYGWRVYGVMSIISDVFRGQMQRVNRIMAVWTSDTSDRQTMWKFQAPGTGLPADPISVCDSIAIAPYLEANRSLAANAQYVWQYNYGDSTQKASALTWLDALWRDHGKTEAFTVNYCNDKLFPAWKTIATTWKARLTMYEGGFGGIPSANLLTAQSYNGHSLKVDDVTNFFGGYYGSSIFAATLRDYLNGFATAGGEYPSQYCLDCGAWGSNGLWGMIQPSMYGNATPAVATLRTYNETGKAT